MSVTVRIPAQLRRLYQTQARETVEAATVAEMLAVLETRYPGIRERLTEPDGQMRRWVNVFVDGQDIREAAGLDTPLVTAVEVYIVPAIAGG